MELLDILDVSAAIQPRIWAPLATQGVIVGNDATAMESVRIGREYGWKQRYVSETVGQNSRMDEIQAAILRVKLKDLASSIDRRREIADTYTEALGGLYRTPKIRQNTEHAFHLYVLQVSDRPD